MKTHIKYLVVTGFLLASFLLLNSVLVQAENDSNLSNGAFVSGIITDQNGLPIELATVEMQLLGSDNSRWSKGDSTGYYYIGEVVPGVYKMVLYAPNNNTGLTSPDPIEIIVGAGDLLVKNFQFIEEAKTIFGTVKLVDGTPVDDAKVEAYGDDKNNVYAYTDSDGTYSMSVAGGEWQLTIFPTTDLVEWTYKKEATKVSFAAGDGNEETNIDFVVSSTTVLPSMAGVSGTVMNYAGQPINDTWVKIRNDSHTYEKGDGTNEKGEFFIDDIEPGDYYLETYAPDKSSDLISPDPVKISLSAGQILQHSFQLNQAIKTIYGKVAYTDGLPVTDARVEAFKDGAPGHSSTQVDAAGNYSFKVNGTDWKVMVYSIDSDNVDWSYAGMTQKVEFSDATTSEQKLVNFEVTRAKARVIGKILNANGSIPRPYTIGVSLSDSFSIAGEGRLDAFGSFSIPINEGTYTLSIYSDDPTLGVLDLDPFAVGIGETVDLGVIKLINKNEHIKGKVTDLSGQGIAMVYVEAFQSRDSAYVRSKTDTDGSYDLYVNTGDWNVSVYPGPDSDYVYTSAPTKVSVSSGQTGIADFKLTFAQATISGAIKDSAGNVLTDVYGWVYAERETTGLNEEFGGLGGNIKRGVFSFNVPAGTYKVNAHLPSDKDYSSGTALEVNVGMSGTVKVDLIVRYNDSIIKGYIKDTNGNIITQKKIEIFVSGQKGIWREADLDPSTGLFTIRLSAGTWYLGAYIKADQGYISKPAIEEPIVIGHGSVVSRDIILVKASSTILGKVTNSAGSPLANVWVSADSRGFKGDLDEEPGMSYMANGTETDSNGNYSLLAPEGTYYIHAFLPPEFGYINPEEQEVRVASGESSQVNLVFRKTDSTIKGVVYLNGVSIEAFIWAWSEKGGFAETRSNSHGSFTLSVAKNDVWHIGAVKELGQDVYKSRDVEIIIGEERAVSLNLQLQKSNFMMPDSVSATLEANKARLISVDDGAEASIPSNSLATSGQVTVTMDPEVEMPSQSLSKVVGIGYNIEARDVDGKLIESLNDEVTISLPYTASQIDEAGVNVDEMKLGYWDETAGTWKELDNSVVDKTNKLVVGSTNHFTRFAILAPESSSETSQEPASIIVDGDIVRNHEDPTMAQYDIYIVKIVGEKKFKRLVLSPHVFESYGHLLWGNVELVDTQTINSYVTSDLVRAYDPSVGLDDPKVYQLTPAGDSGTKQWLNINAERFRELNYDWDSIYMINQTDRDAYNTGADVL